VLLGSAVILLVSFYDATAKHHREWGFMRDQGGGKMSFKPKMPYKSFKRKGLFPTDLETVFPD